MIHIVGDKKFTDYQEALDYEKKMKTKITADFANNVRAYKITYAKSGAECIVLCAAYDAGELFAAFKNEVLGDQFETDIETCNYTQRYTVTKLGVSATYDMLNKVEELPPVGVWYKDVDDTSFIFINKIDTGINSDETGYSDSTPDCDNCPVRVLCEMGLFEH